MTTVLDQTSDVAKRDFHRYAKLYDLPDYVKQADTQKVFERDPQMASTAFADVRNRQFNCSTKAATWVSYLYFLEKKADIHPKLAEWIDQRFDQFAKSWGISPDIESLRTKNAEINTERLQDSDYMLVWAGVAGEKSREYPLRNALEVKTATAWFLDHRDHFVYRDRKRMAEKLVEKISQYGAGVDDHVLDELEKQTGRGTYDPQTAAAHIEKRSSLAPGQPLREAMANMAEKVGSNPGLALQPSTIDEMCHTLDTFDRLVKLSGNYTEMIPRPEDVFCAAAYKTVKAGVDDSCTLVTGSVYSKRDFSKLALVDIRDAFGTDVADSVSFGLNIDPEKFAEVASTLPRPDAQMLDRIMDSAGVRPTMKHATAVKRPDLRELTALAAT